MRVASAGVSGRAVGIAVLVTLLACGAVVALAAVLLAGSTWSAGGTPGAWAAAGPDAPAWWDGGGPVRGFSGAGRREMDAQREALGRWAWADRDRELVNVPIEDAMRLVVEEP